MATMDFFRRPLLAGNNTVRMPLATIRGSLRRSDADGVVAFPYFIGAAATQTLDLSVDGVTFNVVLTGAGMNTVMTDINTELAGAGYALDYDGALAIQTAGAGPTGSVEVTGGTAAAFLGFDLATGRIRAANGDFPSTPEGNRGNWNGVAFPNKGENFQTESVTRAFSRISGNTDVLYSDIFRSDVVLSPAAFSTSDGRLLTLSVASTRVFTGLGTLSAASTREDLAQYFHLIDTATKQLAKSRVVGVVRGAVGGLPVYSNATTWSGGGSAIGNVLGQNLTKTAAATIDLIQNGRVIRSSGSSFTDVVPGDVAVIAAATNTNQWDNNGAKWIVEEVINTTSIAVRPMSKAELALYSVTLNNEHPVLELNVSKNGAEVYGTVSIRTGTFCTAVNVIVDPPIPTGATYELWVSKAKSHREQAPSSQQEGLAPLYKSFASNYDPVENGTLSGFAASQVSTNCVVTAGLFRLHGRVFSLPARTFLPGEFTNGTNYLYWDDATGNFSITLTASNWTSVLNPGVTTNKGHLIAQVTLSGGVITSVLPVLKLRGENAVSVTIGVGGQFTTIEGAALWAQGLVTGNSETVSSSGAYPHFDFILVSDLTLTSQIPLGTIPSLTIRGITDTVRLMMGNNYFNFGGKRLEVRDFSYTSTADSNYFVRITGVSATEKVVVRNIKQVSGNTWAIIETTGTGVLNEAQVLDVDIRLSRNVVKGIGTGGRGVDTIKVLRSKFVYVASGAPHIICHATSAATAWDGDLLQVQDCDFTGSWGSSAGADVDPVFVKEFGAHPTVPSQIVIQNVRMGLGNYPSATSTPLFQIAAATALISNVQVVSGKIPIAVAGGAGVTVRDCNFRVNTEGTNISAITAQLAENTSVIHQDTDAGANGGEGIRLNSKAINCVVGPYFNKGIVINGAGAVEISGCTILSLVGGNAEDLDCSIFVNGTNSARITNNQITCARQIAGTGLSYAIRFTSSNTYLTVTDNWISNTLDGTAIGAVSGSVSKLIFANNTIVSDSVTEQGADFRLATEATVSGNSLNMTGGVGSVGLRGPSGSSTVRFESNYVLAATAYAGSANFPSTFLGNHFNGAVTALHGVAEGNVFTSTVGGSSLIFSDNTVTGNVVFAADIFASNNTFGADVTSGTASSFEFNSNNVQGAFSANLLARGFLTGNYFVGAVSFSENSGVEVIFSSNKCVTDVEMDVPHFTVTGCDIDGNFTSDPAEGGIKTISACQVGGIAINPTGSGSIGIFSNWVGFGSINCNRSGKGTQYETYTDIMDNHLLGGTLDATAGFLNIYNNRVPGLITGAGYQHETVSNIQQGFVNIIGNHAERISAPEGSIQAVNDNTVVGYNSEIPAIFVSSNWLTGGTFGASFGHTISNNRIRQNNVANSPNNSPGVLQDMIGAIQIGTTSGGITSVMKGVVVSGNTMEVTDGVKLGPATGTNSFVGNAIYIAGQTDGVVITGNFLRRPSAVTVNSHLYSWNLYSAPNNSQGILWNANVVHDAAGSLGTTGTHAGDRNYAVGASTIA